MGEKANSDELLKRLRKEEMGRKGGKPEVALAATMKKGGEARIIGADPPKKHKAGTPFFIPNGSIIECKSNDRYRIETTINQRVFVVRSIKTERLYAMKIEWLSKEKADKQMLREVHLLTDAGRHETRFSRHFPRMLNKGRVPKAFNFLVMTFGSFNLNDIRSVLLKNCDFSKADAARLSMQTFQAVHDLHSLGYLHRDINPNKFVLGLHDPEIVLMIGFSRSLHFDRKYDIKPSGSPRKLPKMDHRVFLPRNYHRQKDLYRKDDLESWIYLSFNLFGRRLLPWNENFADTNMLVAKERLFCDGYEDIYKHVPKQFLTIMHNLDKHHDGTSRPDYTYIGMTLVAMKETVKFHMAGPFDFQKKAGSKPKSPSRPPADDKHSVAVIDPKDDVAKGPTGPAKKKGGFKDDSESDSSSSKKQRAAPKAPSTHPAAASARPVAPAVPPRPTLVAGTTPPPAGQMYSEKDRLRREKEELDRKMAELKHEKAKTAIEKEEEEKQALAKKVKALEAEHAKAVIDRERLEKEELEAKVAAAKDELQLERVRREKEELLAKLAELEAQKHRPNQAGGQFPQQQQPAFQQPQQSPGQSPGQFQQQAPPPKSPHQVQPQQQQEQQYHLLKAEASFPVNPLLGGSKPRNDSMYM